MTAVKYADGDLEIVCSNKLPERLKQYLTYELRHLICRWIAAGVHMPNCTRINVKKITLIYEGYREHYPAPKGKLMLPKFVLEIVEIVLIDDDEKELVLTPQSDMDKLHIWAV